MKILAMFKKEFYSYLNTSQGYIVLFLFTLISGWLFMKPFFLINEASMRLFFELIPWFFLFFIPAITMGSLVFPWASSILKGKADVLISSSKSSWSQEAYFDLNPEQRFIPKIRKSFPLAVSLSFGKGRVVIVGNSRFIEDRFLSQFTNNHIFFMNSVDWLSFGDSLVGIRSKGKTERPLKPLSPFKKAFIKNLVIFLSPLIAIIIGVIRLCMPKLP